MYIHLPMVRNTTIANELEALPLNYKTHIISENNLGFEPLIGSNMTA